MSLAFSSRAVIERSRFAFSGWRPVSWRRKSGSVYSSVMAAVLDTSNYQGQSKLREDRRQSTAAVSMASGRVRSYSGSKQLIREKPFTFDAHDFGCQSPFTRFLHGLPGPR